MSREARESGGPRYSTPLHGLRGLAALIVVFGHASNLSSTYGDNEPIVLLANGSACVVLFFVLSGLVLAPSATVAASSIPGLIRFFIRRIFRLMPLMIIVNIISILFVVFIHPRLKFPEPLTGNVNLVQFLVSFFGATIRVNGPSWSIFVELCASALMPLIMLFVRRPFVLLSLAISFVLASLPISLPYHANMYLFPFCVGAALHRWSRAGNEISATSALMFLVAGLAALIFYSSRPIIQAYGIAADINSSIFVVLCETISVAPLVWMFYNNKISGKFLSIPPMRFLGDVSYGLYLIHFNVVTCCYNFFRAVGLTGANRLMIATSLLAVAISLPLAWLSHRTIELPGIRLGAHVARRVSDLLPAKWQPKSSTLRAG